MQYSNMHTKLEEGGATSYPGLRIGIRRETELERTLCRGNRRGSQGIIGFVQGKQKREARG